MNMGEMLLCYRLQKNLSVRDMGKLLGISAATVSRLENGKNGLDGHTMLKLINWLFGDDK